MATQHEDLKGILASIDLNSLNKAEKIAFCHSAALVEQAAALTHFSQLFDKTMWGSNQAPGVFEKIAMELDNMSQSFERISSSLSEYVIIAGNTQTETET